MNNNIKMLQNVFGDILKDKNKDIEIFPKNGYGEIIIHTQNNFKIKIYHEVIDNLYNISILYNNGNSIIITSYKSYKSFVKKSLSQKKSDIWEHMKIFKNYLLEYESLINNYNEFIHHLFNSKTEYHNIFI